MTLLTAPGLRAILSFARGEMTKIEQLFSESGVRVPEGYDEACFRCGKPRNVRGDEEGLCIDCFDECSYMTSPGQGFEAGVRAELAKGRWFIQSGQNHWQGSLLPDIPEEMIESAGIDPDEPRAPISVFESINGPRKGP